LAKKIEWQLNKPASDAWALENGNILAAMYPTKQLPGGAIVEINRQTKEFVWKYSGQQKETSTVQQIVENEYLVEELDANPRAIVINREGKILSEMQLQCQKENIQTWMFRKLENGFCSHRIQPAIWRGCSFNCNGRSKT